MPAEVEEEVVAAVEWASLFGSQGVPQSRVVE
jgi:hypothetical protein